MTPKHHHRTSQVQAQSLELEDELREVRTELSDIQQRYKEALSREKDAREVGKHGGSALREANERNESLQKQLDSVRAANTRAVEVQVGLQKENVGLSMDLEAAIRAKEDVRASLEAQATGLRQQLEDMEREKLRSSARMHDNESVIKQNQVCIDAQRDRIIELELHNAKMEQVSRSERVAVVSPHVFDVQQPFWSKGRTGLGFISMSATVS